jgi:hypothetical protein
MRVDEGEGAGQRPDLLTVLRARNYFMDELVTGATPAQLRWICTCSAYVANDTMFELAAAWRAQVPQISLGAGETGKLPERLTPYAALRSNFSFSFAIRRGFHL